MYKSFIASALLAATTAFAAASKTPYGVDISYNESFQPCSSCSPFILSFESGPLSDGVHEYAFRISSDTPLSGKQTFFAFAGFDIPYGAIGPGDLLQSGMIDMSWSVFDQSNGTQLDFSDTQFYKGISFIVGGPATYDITINLKISALSYIKESGEVWKMPQLYTIAYMPGLVPEPGSFWILMASLPLCLCITRLRSRTS